MARHHLHQPRACLTPSIPLDWQKFSSPVRGNIDSLREPQRKKHSLTSQIHREDFQPLVTRTFINIDREERVDRELWILNAVKHGQLRLANLHPLICNAIHCLDHTKYFEPGNQTPRSKFFELLCRRHSEQEILTPQSIVSLVLEESAC
jgi:hypothetical protein